MKNSLVYSEKPRFYYKAISAYKEVQNPSEWQRCPICNLIPMIWEFDNGRKTACGCGKSEYDHHSIMAESVCSALIRASNEGSNLDFNIDDLRKNWNLWATTGVILFTPGNGKW